jgi:hypothetical protein
VVFDAPAKAKPRGAVRVSDFMTTEYADFQL